MTKKLISHEMIARRILFLRGQKVMLDQDLALLYGVETKYLTRQVRRNKERFPADFMFRLTKDEFLRCQNVTSKRDDRCYIPCLRSQTVTLKRGGRRYMPYAFTEQGVAMLSSVLRSKRAAQVNIAIMRAFVKLREILSANKVLAEKLNQLEQKLGQHDQEIKAIFQAIHRLMSHPQKRKKEIGFH